MREETGLNLSPQRINFIIFIILIFYPLLGMGVDLIAPSLPAISQNLKISSTFSKNLIAIYLFGYACGNFIIGFVADALGRRKLIIYGFLIFTIFSLLPAIFPSAAILLIGRFIQGLSIAAFAVIGRAIFSDILAPERLIRVAGLIATMWGIGPIIGPMIGGYLQYYFGWQSCFYFFSIFGLLGFLASTILIPETHHNLQKLNFIQIKQNFSTIVSHPLFMGMVTLMGISYSLLIVFNTLGPFLIQESFGYSSIFFGRIALCMGITFLIGTMICRRLTKNFQPEKILSFAVPCFLLIALVGLAIIYFSSKNVWVITILSLLMFLGCGIIFPAGMGRGLALFRHLAGSGSAIMNLINILITSFTAFVMGFVMAQSSIPIAMFYLILMAVSALVWWFLIRRNNAM